MAAETHVDRSIDGPKNFIQTNIVGTFSLLEALRQLQKRKINPKLIHVSTDEVYGDIKKNTILVTGGAGFVGTNLIKLLLTKTNYKILSLDNYSSGSKLNHIKSPRL